MKKINGEVISVQEIYEKNTNHVKLYGIALRYDSRSGTHNCYKESRDVSVCGAIS